MAYAILIQLLDSSDFFLLCFPLPQKMTDYSFIIILALPLILYMYLRVFLTRGSLVCSVRSPNQLSRSPGGGGGKGEEEEETAEDK